MVQVTTLIMTVPPLVKNDSDSGAEKADLSSWDWEDLSSDESNSSSKTSLEDKTSSSSLKADELKNGNYKSACRHMEVLKWNDHQNYFGWTIGTLGECLSN